MLLALAVMAQAARSDQAAAVPSDPLAPPATPPAEVMMPAAARATPPQAAEAGMVGSDKLLLIGGVNQVEGAAGGGLTPWALIGGYGTRDEIGANAFCTRVDTRHYHLDDAGVLVGFHDRLEVSLAQQRFDTEDVGTLLGLGRGFTLRVDTVGLKVKLAGNAVLDQSSWLPQIAVGLQYKRNDEGGVHGLFKAIGARSTTGTDFYASATKIFLDQSLLVSATARLTRANQIGILGFGGDHGDGYRLELEGSAALLLNRHLALGAEYRMKPDNLGIAREDDWYDAFVAWAPTKHVTFTLAYAYLGNVMVENDQHGPYASLQVGF